MSVASKCLVSQSVIDASDALRAETMAKVNADPKLRKIYDDTVREAQANIDRSKTRLKRKVSGEVVRVEETPPMVKKPRKHKSERTLRIDKLDAMWSLAVRLRDNFTDRKTGIRDPGKGIMEAMHIYGRSNYATRWITDNGLTGGYYTHICWAHRCPVEFAQWAEQELGPEAWKKLTEQSKQMVKVNTAFMDEAEKRLLAEIDDYSMSRELT